MSRPNQHFSTKVDKTASKFKKRLFSFVHKSEIVIEPSLSFFSA